MSIRYERQGLKVVRVKSDLETVLKEAEAIRDEAALLEGQIRDTRRRAQVLVAGLLADHTRRQQASPFSAHLAAPKGRATAVQLRRARVLARVSQRQLAATWGYSRGAIAAYEDGQSPRRIPEGISAWALQVLRVAGEEED